MIESICAGIMTAISAREMRRVQRLPLPTLEGFSLQLASTTLMHRSSRRDLIVLEKFSKSRLTAIRGCQSRVPGWRNGYVLTRHAWPRGGSRSGIQRAPWNRRGAPSMLRPNARLRWPSKDLSIVLCCATLAAPRSGAEPGAGDQSERFPGLAFLRIVQAFRGDGEMAMASADKAIELSPLDPLRHYYDALACTAALAARRLPRAIELASRALRVNRDHLPTSRALTIAQVESGALEDARRTAVRVLALEPNLTLRDTSRARPRAGKRHVSAMQRRSQRRGYRTDRIRQRGQRRQAWHLRGDYWGARPVGRPAAQRVVRQVVRQVGRQAGRPFLAAPTPCCSLSRR